MYERNPYDYEPRDSLHPRGLKESYFLYSLYVLTLGSSLTEHFFLWVCTAFSPLLVTSHAKIPSQFPQKKSSTQGLKIEMHTMANELLNEYGASPSKEFCQEVDIQWIGFLQCSPSTLKYRGSTPLSK